MVFAVAQAAGGGLLLLCQVWLTPAQVTGVGVLFGAVMLGVHHFMGRSYTQSLMALLRSGSVNLNDVAEGTFRLPNSYVTEIRQLLNQSDRKAQQLGLELATRLENPGQFLTEIQALRSQAKDNPDLQWMALEIEIKIATLQGSNADLNAKISILKSQLSNPQSSPQLQHKCLKTLATIARPGDVALGELAATMLHAPTPLVRAAAYRLLGVVRPASGLPAMVTGLKDLDPNVRQQAATAIAAFGEACLPLVDSYLQSAHPEVAAAAVSAIGQTRTKRAEDMLYHYLREDLQQVAATLQWQAQLPAEKPEFATLANRPCRLSPALDSAIAQRAVFAGIFTHGGLRALPARCHG
ncbi:MAG: HEAT repeat domain-containing protein [Coleofasciculaceae cyanobacterium SM2_3_26]|nr:HEAT repeat domain-containing protein [Coleofasciculaceae cyanobacterium SM2_3_26]